MPGIITHELEGVLRLALTEHVEVQVLGVASSDTGGWLSYSVRRHQHEDSADGSFTHTALSLIG